MRLLCAMSGGVDSSTVAALLVEQGHEVIGVTLLLHPGTERRRPGACCAGEDIADARAVADRLGIAHYVIDGRARFRAAVIEDFADTYAAGETPVPCIRCNQSVKFTDLVALADDLGAEALATGHYVRRVDGPAGPELHRARDAARDQSWFMFATTLAALARCRFPLGDYESKAAVRAEAKRLGLQVAAKPDSQDLCFVPDGRTAEAVGRLRPEALAAGEIVGRDGAVLGRHTGIARYTVGQGRRLGPAAARDGVRQVVVGIDAGRRRIVVGPASGGRRVIQLGEVNWLVPAAERRCEVRLRSGDAPRPARLTPTAAGALVTLDDPALAAPGQACVFHDGSRVLGGGFIRREAPREAVDLAAPVALSAPPSGHGGVAQR